MADVTEARTKFAAPFSRIDEIRKDFYAGNMGRALCG
jgi:hypothetical protein